MHLESSCAVRMRCACMPGHTVPHAPLPPCPCRLHPSDGGHQVLAELLASVVVRAAGEVLAGPAAAQQPGAAGALAAAFPLPSRSDPRLPQDLPPPMIAGNEVAATTLCAIQVGGQPARAGLPHACLACACSSPAGRPALPCF